MEIDAEILAELATRRKTVRRFKPDIPADEDIKRVLEIACQAPSGSNDQPWRFLIIDDTAVKARVRQAAEAGEKDYYESISEERKNKFKAMGLSWKKPMLENAPVLIAVVSDINPPNSHPSVWLAVGYLILALEAVGLGTVTYTPSDYKKVQSALGIPERFRLETILPIGYSNDSKEKGYRKPWEEVAYKNHWGKPVT